MLHVIRQVQTQKQAFPGTAHNHSTSSQCVREVCAGPLLPSPARVSPHDFFLAGCTPELGRKSSPAPTTMMYPITCECKTSAQDPTALCPFHLSLSFSIRSFFASCILSVHLCTFPFSLSLCVYLSALYHFLCQCTCHATYSNLWRISCKNACLP